MKRVYYTIAAMSLVLIVLFVASCKKYTPYQAASQSPLIGYQGGILYGTSFYAAPGDTESIYYIPKELSGQACKATIIDLANEAFEPSADTYTYIKVTAHRHNKDITGWVKYKNFVFTESYDLIPRILPDILADKPYTKLVQEQYKGKWAPFDQEKSLEMLKLLLPEHNKIRSNPDKTAIAQQLFFWETVIPQNTYASKADGTTPLHYSAQTMLNAQEFNEIYKDLSITELNLTTGPDANTPYIDAVLANNAELVHSFFKSRDIEHDYRNAVNKTAKEYGLESKDQRIKNIFTYSENYMDYYPLLNKLLEKNKALFPKELFIQLPVTLYYRSLRIHESLAVATYDGFVTGLSLAEEEEALNPEYVPNEVSPFSAQIVIPDGSPVKLHETPAVDGTVVTSVQSPSVVTVLQQYETPEEINGTYDYWYQVSLADGTTGWCFGDYIQKDYLISSSHYLHNTLGYMYRTHNENDTTYSVISDCTLYTLDDTQITLHTGDTVTFLYAFTNAHPVYQGNKELTWWLVQTKDYVCGLVLNDGLALHLPHTDAQNNFDFYVQYWEHEAKTASCALILACDSKTRTMHPITFEGTDTYSDYWAVDQMLNMNISNGYENYYDTFGIKDIKVYESKLGKKKHAILAIKTIFNRYYHPENAVFHMWTMDAQTYNATNIDSEEYIRQELNENQDNFTMRITDTTAQGGDFTIESYHYGSTENAYVYPEQCIKKIYIRSYKDIGSYSYDHKEDDAVFPGFETESAKE